MFKNCLKDEREDRKPAEEEKHQKIQERIEKLDRKDIPNSNEATLTSRGTGEDSMPRSEESQNTADIEILRSEVNGQGEEAQQKVDRHQFLDKQERKRLPQKPFMADSRQSPDKPGFQQQFSEKVQVQINKMFQCQYFTLILDDGDDDNVVDGDEVGDDDGDVGDDDDAL